MELKVGKKAAGLKAGRRIPREKSGTNGAGVKVKSLGYGTIFRLLLAVSLEIPADVREAELRWVEKAKASTHPFDLAAGLFVCAIQSAAAVFPNDARTKRSERERQEIMEMILLEALRIVPFAAARRMEMRPA